METDTVYERINYRFCNVSRSRSVCNVHDNAGHAWEKGNFGKKVGSGVRVIFEEICRFVCRKTCEVLFAAMGNV